MEHIKKIDYPKVILKACQDCLDFLSQRSLEEFEHDSKTVSAVLYQIILVGESSKNTSDDFKRSYQEIDWKKIAMIGDEVLSHYYATDIGSIWKIANREISQLHQLLKVRSYGI